MLIFLENLEILKFMFLRIIRESRFLRTKIIQSPDKKNMRILVIEGSLTLPQYAKLVKFITEESDFCNIVK